MAPERAAADADAAVIAASALGFPVVLKLNGDGIAHKTERGLVRLGVRRRRRQFVTAAAALLAAARPEDGDVDLLVAPMVSGMRELIAGAVRDPQFGPTVMLGVGGVLAEAVDDVVFRPAPLDRSTATEMIDDLRTAALLGPFRGESAVDREALASALVALGRVIIERDDVASIDVNPLDRSRPTVRRSPSTPSSSCGRTGTESTAARRRSPPTAEQFAALFEPRGVVVAGASTHPGKFGFVSLHNLLASGYAGAVLRHQPAGRGGARRADRLPTSPRSPTARPTSSSCARRRPPTPTCSRRARRRGSRRRSSRRPATPKRDRRASAPSRSSSTWPTTSASCSPARTARASSAPRRRCAPRSSLRTRRPAASPSPARAATSCRASSTSPGRPASASRGRSRRATPRRCPSPTTSSFYADDPATGVGLAYLEGISDGRALFDQLADAARRKPLVLLKGGATAGGARAAASHTGALAADDKVFDGECRAAGITRAATVEEAFEAAATFATQPAPRGPRVVVVTTAGGWGVVTADAITTDRDLELIDLPDDLRDAIDDLLPPRWSRGNPIDCAGGETRDTIPDVLELVAEHDSVDAVVYSASASSRIRRG